MKRHRRKPKGITGMVRRGQRAYYSRMLPEAVGGDRICRSLGASWGSEEAGERAGALNTLWSRGDWPVLRRWNSGEVHTSLVVRAVREGDWGLLKRLNADGLLLGAVIQDHRTRTEATRRRGTIETYAKICDRLLQHFGADLPMHAVTTAACEAFLHREWDTGVWAPATQKLYRSAAGAIWRYAIDRETEEAEQKGLEATLRRNPWRKAQVMAARKKRPQVLTEAELRALIHHPSIAGTPQQALLAIAGYAGLRLQEILNLRMGIDVDLEAGVIRVQSRAGAEKWDTKTANSQADVRIPDVLVEILRAHIAAGFSGVRYLLISRGRDRPIHRATAQGWVRAAFQAAGIQYGRTEGEGLTIHSLRHSHATILLSKGVSIAAVAARLRDTQEVVLRTYSHALPDDQERAVRVWDVVPQNSPIPHQGEKRDSGANESDISQSTAPATPAKKSNAYKASKHTDNSDHRTALFRASSGPVEPVSWLTTPNFNITRTAEA